MAGSGFRGEPRALARQGVHVDGNLRIGRRNLGRGIEVGLRTRLPRADAYPLGSLFVAAWRATGTVEDDAIRREHAAGGASASGGRGARSAEAQHRYRKNEEEAGGFVHDKARFESPEKALEGIWARPSTVALG